MNLQETIEECIRWYPGIFPSRTYVLDHLFCVIENGYEWSDELVDVFAEHEKAERTVDNAVWAGEWERFAEVVGEKILSEPSMQDIFEKTKKDFKRKELESRKIHKEYKERASKDYPEDKFVTWYPICEYSGLVNFPDNIKSDWADGIRETAEKILATTEEEWKTSRMSVANHSWDEMLSHADYALIRLEELDEKSMG